MKQLELFNDLYKSGSEKPFKKKTQHANNLRKLRYGIFILIYTIIVLILGFVLGLNQKQEQPQPEVNQKQVVKQAIKKEAPKIKRIAQVKSKVKNRYIIQVASFKKIASAKIEKDALKKAGFKTYTSISGKYTKVCIGPFKTKAETEKNLKKLKAKYPKKYQDCFIMKSR